MLALYSSYKQTLEEKLTTLGFNAEPEDPSGLSHSIRLAKDDITIFWMYDLRDNLLFLKGKKVGKVIGKATFGSKEKKDHLFPQKLYEPLISLGFDVEAPKTKSAGFLSRLFGKK